MEGQKPISVTAAPEKEGVSCVESETTYRENMSNSSWTRYKHTVERGGGESYH